MATSKIEWLHDRNGFKGKVWNPVTGCSKVSTGCLNCYAERMAKRLAGRFGYPKNEPFKVTLHPERLNEPLLLKKPKRIFVCSMGDLFHDKVPDWFIDEIFEVMAACPQHTFIILTKRPENIETKLYGFPGSHPSRELGGGDYLPTVWIGVSVEDQKMADERIPILLSVPAAKHIVSIEPMLGPVDLEQAGGTDWWESAGILWVILGGETGPGARPMNPGWARNIRDQCQASGVSFFFKSFGGKDRKNRILDGRTWDEIPGVARGFGE